MRYRIFQPQSRLILDAFVAAVLLTILGLTSSFFIQVLVDCVFVHQQKLSSIWLGLSVFGLRSHLFAHLSRGIHAGTVLGYRRHLRGLPYKYALSSLEDLRTFFLVTSLIAIAAAWGEWMTAEVLVPAPNVIMPDSGPVAIVAEVSGRIQHVYVNEDATVRPGDPLIQLDTQRLLLQKQTLETRIHLAELNVTNARAELPGLYRELQRIQLDLDRCTITSPISGQVVSLASLGRGEMLLKGTAIALAVPRRNGPD
jgi:multidrug efflux pump subunit AcrA (membrane-fusion protein)